ncbi:GntR family transcriptional regulator [Paenibacillus radicis (ex Xue et al. 2023)]|uniref:GntR family transcriptional regulator n=1 Tax=Paenibacillus radicis (ex Xue et al. 2023) TaxID=2972489 RepID=A0ABT1YHP9_9BACL|nr:GntR family transcriptional regulator [Paenibacillus radicis (ex Xue et al. 2023)]MCR8632719.1 GntR family transcriptional regulator [Paenibacillus radicis (ex Xue et al. 2023)]
MQLDRNTQIPLYEQLKNLIAQQINEGTLEPDQQIPSERELCEAHGVSRITVRQAIAAAANEGLLYRTQGKGTYVAGSKIEQKLSNINNFQQTLVKQGFMASTQLYKTETIPNNLFYSRLLNVNMMEQITNIQLVGFGNEEPVVFYDSFFSMQIGQSILKAAQKAVDDNVPFSTLDLYYPESTVTPTHVEQTFESIVSDDALSSILKIATGSPILLVTSIIYDNQQPVEYKNAYYRGDKYKFFLTREYSDFNLRPIKD